METKTDKELAVDIAKTYIVAFMQRPRVTPIKSENLPAILKNAYKAVANMDK